MEQKIKKVVLVSFGDHRYRNALKRLETYTEKFPFTERHFCDETNTFSKSYWRKLKPWFYRRGFGYWQWKADIVKFFYDKMDEGDIIVYSDCGIVWNPSTNALIRFNEYLQMLSSTTPILAFQEPYIEREWTKGDLLKAVNVYDDDSICGSLQLWTGCFILLKCKITDAFLKDWIPLNDLSKELITDKRSIVPNKIGFKEHRHDQSTFSVVAKKYPHITISWCETNSRDGNWNKLADYPVHAHRTKEINRPKSVVLKNKLLKPWRLFLNFYFRKIRNYEFIVKSYPW